VDSDEESDKGDEMDSHPPSCREGSSAGKKMVQDEVDDVDDLDLEEEDDEDPCENDLESLGSKHLKEKFASEVRFA